MNESVHPHYIAFENVQCIASGDLRQVALKVKEIVDANRQTSILIFDAATSALIDLDLRGPADDVLKRLPQMPDKVETGSAPPDLPRGPGRPRLGVVAREVTLMPRHWEWLNAQTGGASVALRKLVEEAKRAGNGKDRIRRAQESSYRFMSAMAGNRPGFEEAARALFAGHRARFNELIDAWPVDVRDHLKKLATIAFPENAGESA